MFNIQNWFWKAEDGRIYGSLKQALIDETDTDFSAWLNEGNLPTPWPKDIGGVESDEALAEVLNAQGLSLYAPTLDEIKNGFKRRIDSQAELERLKYITDGVGQSLTYDKKLGEAVDYTREWLAYLREKAKETETPKAVPPSEGKYLFLQSSLGIDGDTLAEVAETITWMHALWEPIGAAIEKIRLQSKSLIDASETAVEAQEIFDAVKWP